MSVGRLEVCELDAKFAPLVHMVVFFYQKTQNIHKRTKDVKDTRKSLLFLAQMHKNIHFCVKDVKDV